MRVVERLRRTRYLLTCFFAGRNEDEARLEVARSTRAFSGNTRAVIDDKLSFSAALMRAGEVRAAYRMMEEAEDDVHQEEARLLARVDRVSAAGSTPRARMTRLRLARVLATACLMAGSVFGVALAGAIVDRLTPDARAEAPVQSSSGFRPPSNVRRIEVAPGVKVALTTPQLRTFRAIRRGKAVSHYEVSMLLDGLRPKDVGALLTNLPAERVSMLLARLPSDVVTELRERFGIVTPIMADLEAAASRAPKAEERQAEDDASPAAESERSEPSEEQAQSPETAEPQAKAQGEEGDGGGQQARDDDELKIELPEASLP